MEAFQIGALTIKYVWLFYLISGVIAFYVIKNKTKNHPVFQSRFLDSGTNALLIGFIVYKLSIGLFRPDLLMNNPAAIFFLPGGLKEFVTGLLTAGFYMGYSWQKHHWPAKLAASSIVYGIVTFILAFWAIRTIFHLFV